MKRPPAKDFQDLIVWQKAHRFVLSLYHYSESFPKSERYGLISQAEERQFQSLQILQKVLRKKQNLTRPDI
jgi:hypothetical protein